MPLVRAAPPVLASALLLAVATIAPATGQQAPPQDVVPTPLLLTLGAGPEGSAQHALGLALAEQIGAGTGWAVRVEPTGGAVPNAVLLHEGRIDLALLPLDTAWAARRGEIALAPGLPLETLRALAPVSQAVVRFDPAGEPVGTPGLAGLVVAVPEREARLAAIVTALGSGAAASPEVVMLPPDGLEEAIGAGRVAAVARYDVEADGGVPPVPLRLAPAEVEAALAALPWLAPAEIRVPLPPDADPAVTTPLPPFLAVAVWTWLVAGSGLDAGVAQRVTAVLAGGGPDPLPNTVLPFHPGAVAAWAAEGVAIPADRIAR